MTREYDTGNVFAKILRGEIPCKKVFEDDAVLSFYDISPKAELHVLVIPKGEYVDFADFTAKAGAAVVDGFMKKVAEIAGILNVVDKGYRLVMNVGKGAGQEVPHFHVHILSGHPLPGF